MKGQWTHAACEDCFARVQARQSGMPGRPSRLVDPDLETCCYCGEQTTSGLYVRDDPQALHPGGVDRPPWAKKGGTSDVAGAAVDDGAAGAHHDSLPGLDA